MIAGEDPAFSQLGIYSNLQLHRLGPSSHSHTDLPILAQQRVLLFQVLHTSLLVQEAVMRG